MELTLSDLRELLTQSGTEPQPLAENGQRVIVVLQRGWVAVGLWEQHGTMCELLKASIVRRWGTTAGLGELANKGPLENTTLDPAAVGLRFHVLSVVCIFPCLEAVWK